MLPKIEFRFSSIYNRVLNPEISPEEFISLKKSAGKFINFAKKRMNKILQLIEKHNKPWKRDYIPIYFVSAKIKSFSDPLTLRYRKDHKFLFLILIHELIHNNITKKYKDSVKLHKDLDVIYRKVIKDLDLKGFEEAHKKYEKIKGF